MSLVGYRYLQTSDPGAVGVGYQWLHPTTGILKERNTSDDAWVIVGNVSSSCYGMLPLTGGEMQGPITGASGWAPAISPNFATTAQLASVSLATTNDLTSLSKTLTKLIEAYIESGFAQLSSNISITGSLAFSAVPNYPYSGVVLAGAAIPLPSYSDRQATNAEIKVMLPVTQVESNDGANPEAFWVIDPATRIATVETRDPAIFQDNCYPLIICLKAT